jgi:hypothetical protein
VTGMPHLSDIFLASILIVQCPNFRRSLPECIGAGSFRQLTRCRSYSVSRGAARRESIASALDRFGDALGPVLPQRRYDKWRALEAQPLAIANNTIDEGSIQKLPGSTNQMPAEPAQPATIMRSWHSDRFGSPSLREPRAMASSEEQSEIILARSPAVAAANRSAMP